MSDVLTRILAHKRDEIQAGKSEARARESLDGRAALAALNTLVAATQSAP